MKADLKKKKDKFSLASWGRCGLKEGIENYSGLLLVAKQGFNLKYGLAVYTDHSNHVLAKFPTLR